MPKLILKESWTYFFRAFSHCNWLRMPFFAVDMMNLPIMHLTAKRSNPESCVALLKNSKFFLDHLPLNVLHAHTILIHLEIPCIQPSVFFSGKVHCTLFKLLFFKGLYKIYKVFWICHYLHQKRLSWEVTPSYMLAIVWWRKSLELFLHCLQRAKFTFLNLNKFWLVLKWRNISVL